MSNTIPKEDIEYALTIERNVKKSDKSLYLECLNHIPMSKRTTPQELRDGCILTGIFISCKDM